MPDNDTYVQVQPNSTGAKVDCVLLDNGNVRQTVTIGDPALNSSVASVLNGTLAAADVLDVGIGSPDNAGYAAIIGDPNGDFAGVNLLEAVMDDASGLGINVRILNQNQPLVDGKTINLQGISGGLPFILDCLGYACVQVTMSSTGNAQVGQSNDLTLQFTTPAFFQLASSTSLAPASILAATGTYIIPCHARYLRLTFTVSGIATLVMRTILPSQFPNTITAINVAQWNGSSPISGGVVGVLAVGGVATPGAIATQGNAGNPIRIAGVDSNNIIRGILTDPDGALTVGGWRLPLQPDTKTTNPLPAYVPPLPLKVSISDDTPGPDTLGLLDTLRLMTSLLASIDRRLQELPARLVYSQTDNDDFAQFRDDISILSN